MCDILLVEDDVDFGEMLNLRLASLDYSVLHVTDGHLAQEALRTNNFRLLISDYRLPGRSGLQLSALARGRKQNSNLPIILMSGAVTPEIAKMSSEMKIRKIFVKPFSFSEFSTVIEDAIGCPATRVVPDSIRDEFEKIALGSINTTLKHCSLSKIPDEMPPGEDYVKDSFFFEVDNFKFRISIYLNSKSNNMQIVENPDDLEKTYDHNAVFIDWQEIFKKEVASNAFYKNFTESSEEKIGTVFDHWALHSTIAFSNPLDIDPFSIAVLSITRKSS